MHAYDLVSETIRKQIKLGKYQPGMKLPKEIELDLFADRFRYQVICVHCNLEVKRL